jgi:hypothetical protein
LLEDLKRVDVWMARELTHADVPMVFRSVKERHIPIFNKKAAHLG